MNLTLATLAAAAAITFAASTATAQAQPSNPLAGLDHYIKQSMRTWHVPGLAIAVVKNGKTVMARGYGVRELGESAKVDKDTLFAIASNSKAFTTVSLGMLVDAGKLDWDSHVTDYLKGFKLYDPYPTRELTVRDLLTHRTGDCGGDFLWYGSTNTRAEIIHKLRLLKPRYSFRSRYCYSNNMLLAAGQIIPAITGTRWGKFVENRIFTPLGMTHSNTSITAFKPDGDIAAPHAKVDGKIQSIRWLNWDNMGPAAAVNSSVSDLSRWLKMLLNDGEYKGHRIVSSEVVHEMETPQIVIPPDDKFLHGLNPKSHSLSYGLTLWMDDYHGEHIVWHTGHLDGMSSALGMIPDLHLGVVILTNLDLNSLGVALMNRVFDDYLGVPKQDWSEKILTLEKKSRAKAKQKREKLEAARSAHPHPPLPLTRYAGVYKDPLHGKVKISMQHKHLILERGRHYIGDLQPWNHDTFRVVWHYRYFGKSYVQFGLSPEGKVKTIKFVGSKGVYAHELKPNTASSKSTG